MDAGEMEDVRRRLQEARSQLSAADFFDWEDIILTGGIFDGKYAPNVEVDF